MDYPCIKVNLGKIRENVRIVTNICKSKGIKVVGVTKATSGSIEVAKAMVEGGVQIIGDSKLINLKRFQHIPVKKMLIRLPMISEIKDLVKFVDVSLNSEIEVIRAISHEAEKNNKIHKIILMIDVGDLREGIFEENEVMMAVKEILKLKGIKLIGIGTNLTCFGGIIPSKENLGKLIDIKKKIDDKFGIKLDVVSGGNSSSLCLIENKKMPKGINQLRLGTSLLLGLIEVTWTKIPNTYDNVFKLVTEIIEIKKKPSKPIGKIAMDAFRNTPVFKDKGIMKRAICAIGKQDCEPRFMIPEDEKISIIGSSSDHLILDITDCDYNYRVGDKISFILDYVAILRSMTSPYVKKVYVE
jgi:predicted amino acid racemase